MRVYLFNRFSVTRILTKSGKSLIEMIQMNGASQQKINQGTEAGTKKNPKS